MKGFRRIDRSEALRAARRAASVLAEEPAVRLVYLFGSTVEEGTTGVRDIDLGILVDPRPSPALWRELERRSRLAARIPMDLVPLHDAPPALARGVADYGKSLFARSPDDETRFVVRARAAYWDFLPYLELQWHYSRLRAQERAASPSKAKD